MKQKLTTFFGACLISMSAWTQADLALNPNITAPIVAPDTVACYMSNAENITVTLVNTSVFPYSGTVEMGYTINAGAPVTENQTIGFLPPSGTFIYSFPTPDDFSACQSYDLVLWVYDMNDPNNLNDTISTTIYSDCDPVSGWITGPDTVCAGINNGDFVLNGHVGNVNSWGSSLDNGTTWGWVGTPDTFLTFSNLPSETWVKVIVDSPFGYNGDPNACPSDTTGTYILYTDALSFAGNLTPDFDICDNGNSGSVETTGYNGTVIDWMLSTDQGGGWIPLSSPTDTIWYNNLIDTTWWQVIVKNGTCPADTSAPVIATLIPGSAPGTITGPPVVCNWQNDDSLIACCGNGQVIAWWVSVDSGNTWQPTLNAPGDSTFNFSGITTNTWFSAEWQLGVCPSEFETFNITVLPVVTNITNDTIINEGDIINLNACCGQNYLWWPDQYIDDPTSSSPIVNPDVDITYFVQITSIEGCIDTATVAITVNPDLTTLVVPDLFTPNSDGYNDFWEIGNIDSFTANDLTVFNIYGQVVYSASPYNNDWDGTYNNNKLPDGTYFYLLNLNDPLYPDPRQGVITIAGND